MKLNFFVFFCSFLVYLCNRQTCTSPVYSNYGVTIRGPCSAYQAIAPVNSNVTFECSYSYSGISYLQFWNITIKHIIYVNSPNSNIIMTTHGGSNGYTILTFLITKQDSVNVQCGLCNFQVENCNPAALQPTVIYIITSTTDIIW